MSAVEVRRALLSVYDKGGLIELASALSATGVELVSSGGTARHLSDAGLQVTPVEEVTGSPEMLGGRVKTLHPSIHGGILADCAKPEHATDLAANGIGPFQLVVANLYPFQDTVASGAGESEIIEKIDIGGPAMVRAAAKNHRCVGVVTDPGQYGEIAEAVAGGGLDDDLRLRLARAAFFHTASYDAAIVGWLESGSSLPDRRVVASTKVADLRYGENPHQQAAVYSNVGRAGWWVDAEQLQGKEMSFNNYVDTEAAWRLVNDLPAPGAAVIKHTNAAGAAVGTSVSEAFERAWAGDPLAAFGGVIAINDLLDEKTAIAIADNFVEVVIAVDVTAEAAEVLAGKKNLRVLRARAPHSSDLYIRSVEDGSLLQTRDSADHQREVVTVRTPDETETAQLELAWRIASHTKSNAIVLVKDDAAVGVGAGDQSRVGAARRAIDKAGDRANGAAAASDAFFPFRDGVDALAAAGVTSLIQPGGSNRDGEVVAAADEHNMAMVFTGTRHFTH